MSTRRRSSRTRKRKKSGGGRLVVMGAGLLVVALFFISRAFGQTYDGRAYIHYLIEGDVAWGSFALFLGVGLLFNTAAFVAGRHGWLKHKTRPARTVAMLAIIVGIGVLARLFWSF